MASRRGRGRGRRGGDRARAPASARTSCCSTSRCRGWTACRRCPAARGGPESEVVVLTASGTEENLLAAIRAGAAGYLLKSEPPEQIAEFLRGVAGDRRRSRARSPGGCSSRSAKAARPRRARVDRGLLSARELEVLLLLDEHLGTDEIAERLYISEHTVRSHVKSLLRKLNVSSRREALDALATARACAVIPHRGG